MLTWQETVRESFIAYLFTTFEMMTQQISRWSGPWPCGHFRCILAFSFFWHHHNNLYIYLSMKNMVLIKNSLSIIHRNAWGHNSPHPCYVKHFVSWSPFPNPLATPADHTVTIQLKTNNQKQLSFSLFFLLSFFGSRLRSPGEEHVSC